MHAAQGMYVSCERQRNKTVTVIAAKFEDRSIQFAADRQTTSGSRKETAQGMRLGKLCRVNGMTIGSAGLKSESQWLFMFAKNHAPAEAAENAVAEFFLEFSEWMKKKDNSFRSENEYLVAYRNKLFRVYDSLAVFDIPAHAAIGSGQDFAIAAMHLGRSASDAARVAADLDLYCSGTIDTLSHDIAAS